MRSEKLRAAAVAEITRRGGRHVGAAPSVTVGVVASIVGYRASDMSSEVRRGVLVATRLKLMMRRIIR